MYVSMHPHVHTHTHTRACTRTMQTHTRTCSEALVLPAGTGSIPEPSCSACPGPHCSGCRAVSPLEAEPLCTESPWCPHSTQKEDRNDPRSPGPLKTPCSRSSHALPQPPSLVLHCTDWDPAPSCSAQDLLPAMLTTAQGQPALCHSDSTKALCCFPGKPQRRPLGSRCPSVLSLCPHHASCADPAIFRCPSETKCSGQAARSSARNEASFACVGQGASDLGVEETALLVTAVGERVSHQRVPQGVGGTAWGRAWVSVQPTQSISWYRQLTLCCQRRAARGRLPPPNARTWLLQ